MRSGLAVIMGLSLLVFSACNRGTDRTSAAPEDVQANRDAVLNEQRDHYVKSVQAKLDEMEAKFDGLEERAAAMEGPAKTEFQRGVDVLRAERDMVDAKLDHLREMSADTWTTMRNDVDGALSQLENSYQRLSASHEVK
jgi:hypothetical protein